MSEQLKVTVNLYLGRYNVGDIIVIEARGGIPIDQYWRRKMDEAALNNCITVCDLYSALDKSQIPVASSEAKAKQSASDRKKARKPSPDKNSNTDDSEEEKK